GVFAYSGSRMLRRWPMPAASLRWNVAISPRALVGSMRNGVYMATSPYLRLRGLGRDFETEPAFVLLATGLRANCAGDFETAFFTAEADGRAGAVFFVAGAAVGALVICRFSAASSRR